MQILRQLYPIEIERRDPDSPFVKRPLSERFKNYAKSDLVYRLRPAIFDMLIHYGALFSGSTSTPFYNDSMRQMGPIGQEDENEIMFVFSPKSKKYALWLDRIMAYLAFYHGIKGVKGDISIDTTHQDPVEYVTEKFRPPLSLNQWQSLSAAWHSHILATEQDNIRDELTTPGILRDTMILMHFEMGYSISVVENEDNFSVIFNGGYDNRARARFWINEDAGEGGVRYSLTDKDKKISFPQVLTNRQLYDFVFKTLPEWHVQSGLDPYPALNAFDDRQIYLMKLFHRPFESGNEPPRAKVMPLNAPRVLRS